MLTLNCAHQIVSLMTDQYTQAYFEPVLKTDGALDFTGLEFGGLDEITGRIRWKRRMTNENDETSALRAENARLRDLLFWASQALRDICATNPPEELLSLIEAALKQAGQASSLELAVMVIKDALA
jgi:hypothetical protein